MTKVFEKTETQNKWIAICGSANAYSRMISLTRDARHVDMNHTSGSVSPVAIRTITEVMLVLFVRLKEKSRNILVTIVVGKLVYRECASCADDGCMMVI